MGQRPPIANPLARELIARIRIDIAAAWEQIEAGRAILARSAWLIARWREQARGGEPSLVPQSGRTSVAGVFIELVEERRPPRRAVRRDRRAYAAAARARAREAQGQQPLA
jgi:hypothetical protein